MTDLKQLVIHLTNEQRKLIRKASQDTGIPQSEITRQAIALWMAAHDYKWPDNMKPWGAPVKTESE